MTYTINATAPTAYQFNSLKAFGMGYQKNGNGAFLASQSFDTEEEAKDYLKGRAAMYNDEDPCGSEERLSDMYDSIGRFGSLTLDAVTAHISEVE
jgi:hypothetical protein